MVFKKYKILLTVFLFVGLLNANTIKQALDAYVTNDVSRAMYLFDSECKKDNLFACVRLGILYEYGENAIQDDNIATMFYKKACDGGEISGCEALKNIGEFDIKFDYKKDPNYLDKINNDKLTEASDAYMLNDMKRSFTLFKELCDEGNMQSCARVGLMYEEGNSVEADDYKAREYYEKACNANDGSGCGYLAILQEDALAGFEVDYENADRLYTKSCELGFMTGCYNLAVLYDEHEYVENDYKKATKYYKIACSADDSWACGNLGVLYDYGKGVEQSYTKALDYYMLACEKKNSLGCANAAILYDEGLGVKKNRAKADELFRKACELGDTESC